MDITFITSASYIDTTLPLIAELCKNNKIHLIINSSKNTLKTSFISIEKDFKKNVIINDSYKYLGNALKLLNQSYKLKITVVYWSTLKIIDLRNWLFILKIKNLIKNSQIVHIQTMSFFWLLVLKFNKNRHIIIDYHDPFEHVGSEKSFLLEFSKKFFNNLSDSIIIHNSKQKGEFYKAYNIKNDKVEVIPFGVIPLNKISNNIENFKFNKNSILFFGRISPYKGIEYLLEAFDIVEKEFPDVYLTIAGGGKFYFDISTYKNKDNVNFINRYIPNEELAALINNSKIVVCPYTDASQSGVVMTAFAFNKPVIASNVGGLSDYIVDGHTGILIRPKSSDELANSILKLLRNPKLISNMRKNIEVYCKHGEYSWDTIADKTLEVYKKALNKK